MLQTLLEHLYLTPQKKVILSTRDYLSKTSTANVFHPRQLMGLQQERHLHLQVLTLHQVRHQFIQWKQEYQNLTRLLMLIAIQN